jgi:tyrosyl-tRNA synthetase
MTDKFQELIDRGCIVQFSHEENCKKHFNEGGKTFYLGIDPTADSLHAGHLFQLLNVKRFVTAGHKPIIIVGGGTAVIGDPSDRTEMRSMMTMEIIESNRLALKKQIEKILNIENLTVVNNADWLLPLNYLQFMRDYGIHFKVNELIKKDIYRDRLNREEGLTVFELNYILLQSYDFFHLWKNYNCTMQIGATDQWSNILGGVELIHKKEGGESYAITGPLIARSDGKKMGKTAGGALWLDANKTSAYDFFQYWINIPDADVERFFKYFTFLEISEIQEIMKMDIREAKKDLAFRITEIVHSTEEAKNAKEKSEAIYEGEVDKSQLEVLELESDKNNLVDFLTEKNIFKSKREARDMFEGGGVYIDDVQTKDFNLNLENKKEFVLRIGKKKYFRVVVK